jgi:glutamate/tyrosine decarboxylase-like PLP-dependent enzyme
MALVRDIHLAELRGAGGTGEPPRGRALEGVRVYASDQTHFSIGRALDELGFPAETLAVVPADDDFRLRAAPVAEAVAHDRAADQLNFWRLGFEGTRRWRALKLWLSWKHVGSEGFARLVEANIDLARHMAARIAASPDFEALPADPALSVVCFRHLPAGRPAPARGTPAATELDVHQDRLQHALEASGEGWVSTTRLRGATYLRAGILNTQSTTDDVDELLEILRRLALDA